VLDKMKAEAITAAKCIFTGWKHGRLQTWMDQTM